MHFMQLIPAAEEGAGSLRACLATLPGSIRGPSSSGQILTFPLPSAGCGAPSSFPEPCVIICRVSVLFQDCRLTGQRPCPLCLSPVPAQCVSVKSSSFQGLRPASVPGTAPAALHHLSQPDQRCCCPRTTPDVVSPSGHSHPYAD